VVRDVTLNRSNPFHRLEQTMHRIAVLDAPSNLGLRPPVPLTVPGCYKLPGALRDEGLLRRLGAEDAGYVVPPRYQRGEWKPGDGVFNAPGIAAYSVKLADRVGALLDDGVFPLVLGGECSIMLGHALALARRGRYGVAYLDGHSDFRHLGNSEYVGAAGGEALALITGRGQPDLTDLEGRSPYIRDHDAAVAGIRDDDWSGELRAAGIETWEASRIRTEGAATAVDAITEHLQADGIEGFWVHLDVDILDPTVMPGQLYPAPGGLDLPQLRELLADVAARTRIVGAEITCFSTPELSAVLAQAVAPLLESPGP
jgi:arginase